MSFQASVSDHSSFEAAYLYYDLCERLISFGKLSEVKLLYIFYIYFHKKFVVNYCQFHCYNLLMVSCFLLQALSFAKEAYRIRTLIFKDKFKYSAEKQFKKHNDAGKISEIRTFGITNFQVFKSPATDFWPCGNFLWDINRCYLSPWNVLQCYLESTLQVLFLLRASSLASVHHFSVS